MKPRILRALSTKWDEVPGWTLWEHIAAEMKLLLDANSPGYKQFKSTLTRMHREGLVKSEGHRMAARATWSLTDLGWSLIDGPADDADVPNQDDVEAYVKKRIKADAPVPPAVWAELIRRQKAGELDVVFMPKKTD